MFLSNPLTCNVQICCHASLHSCHCCESWPWVYVTTPEKDKPLWQPLYSWLAALVAAACADCVPSPDSVPWPRSDVWGGSDWCHKPHTGHIVKRNKRKRREIWHAGRLQSDSVTHTPRNRDRNTVKAGLAQCQ